jgi:ribosomal protein L11 methyltransferase
VTWSLRTDRTLDELNLHLAALEAAGLLGIVEVEGRATAYFPERIDGLPIPGRWEPVPDRDWNAEWRAQMMPVVVGSVVVAPPWAQAVPDLPVVIVIDPGQAFGTGHHETTTGCLAALQELDLRAKSVLDVGTGSGVLAIAAARLGAGRVVGVDTDPLAVSETERNASANDVRVEVAEGSAEQVDGQFDVVVANLDTATITTVASQLAARLAERGTLVVSGVSLERLEEAVAALEAAGLAVWARPGAEWAVVTARHA